MMVAASAPEPSSYSAYKLLPPGPRNEDVDDAADWRRFCTTPGCAGDTRAIRMVGTRPSSSVDCLNVKAAERDPNRNIPPCAACHRAGAGGPMEAPVLAEQRDEYLIQQLKLYASGERRNDVYARMRLIASRLTEDEIKGLAAYYRAGFR